MQNPGFKDGISHSGARLGQAQLQAYAEGGARSGLGAKDLDKAVQKVAEQMGKAGTTDGGHVGHRNAEAWARAAVRGLKWARARRGMVRGYGILGEHRALLELGNAALNGALD